MALMICPECNREISDKAETCPLCGFPIAKHLEEQKVELLKQEAIEAKRIKEEKLRAAYQEAQQINKAATETETEAETANAGSNIMLKYIFGIIGILIIFAIYSTIKTSKENEQKAAQEVSQKRGWFNSAKTLITTNQLRDDEIGSAKTSLESIDSSMPEYDEAQRLLHSLNIRIENVEKANEAKFAKERKAAEDAKYTSGGKRVHAKHPNWDADDCNTIAKGQIRIGMTDEQVRAAWGRPYHINRTSGSFGEHEQWVMHEMGGSYVYFENGICTTIQN